MLLSLKTPQEVIWDLSQRIRRHRLNNGWTQEEIARRANVNLSTYRRFEQTGEISLARLAEVASALGILDELDAAFQPKPAQSLAELTPPPKRQRGKRRNENP